MSGPQRVVCVAIARDLVIAVAKFGAAAHTGSAAMRAEGFHSLVDSGNQWLLRRGVQRSRLAADDGHPFGHGKATCFWAPASNGRGSRPVAACRSAKATSACKALRCPVTRAGTTPCWRCLQPSKTCAGAASRREPERCQQPGKRLDAGQITQLRRIIAADPAVTRVCQLLALQPGPEKVLLTAAVRFERRLDLDAPEHAIDRLERANKLHDPSIPPLFLESGALKRVSTPPRRTAAPGAPSAPSFPP